MTTVSAARARPGGADRGAPPTLILTNGNVRTMVTADARASAVAVDGNGRILAVGSNADVLNLKRRSTMVSDLRGRTLIPGFFDCHMHLRWLGQNLGNVDVGSPVVSTAGDIVRLLRDRLEQRPDVALVEGNRYNQNYLPGGKHISRLDLDRVSMAVPVRVVHASGHAAVVNTRALQLLGIHRDTPDPPGGEIARDEHGEPTGVLLETASWRGLSRIVPDRTPAETVAALERASTYLLERGVTSATDANTHPEDVKHFARAAAGSALRVRTNCMVSWAEVMSQAGARAPAPDDLQPAGILWDRVHVGQAKLFADGAITTRTCWVSAPFAESRDNYGAPIHEPQELIALVWQAHNAGWQIATHAIGDRAVDLVLRAYAQAQRRRPRRRPSHRIEHCMLLTADLIARLRRQNVWSIGQPEFLYALGEAYVRSLGARRAARLSPYATLEASCVAQAFSSDCPVVQGAPLDGMRAAITRKAQSGRILGAKERWSAAASLYAYTAAPAYATRTDRDRGSIEPGKWADFALLSADPVTTPIGDWDSIGVLATYVAGECVYGNVEAD